MCTATPKREVKPNPPSTGSQPLQGIQPALIVMPADLVVKGHLLVLAGPGGAGVDPHLGLEVPAAPAATTPAATVSSTAPPASTCTKLRSEDGTCRLHQFLRQDIRVKGGCCQSTVRNHQSGCQASQMTVVKLSVCHHPTSTPPPPSSAKSTAGHSLHLPALITFGCV